MKCFYIKWNIKRLEVFIKNTNVKIQNNQVKWKPYVWYKYRDNDCTKVEFNFYWFLVKTKPQYQKLNETFRNTICYSDGSHRYNSGHEQFESSLHTNISQVQKLKFLSSNSWSLKFVLAIPLENRWLL